MPLTQREQGAVHRFKEAVSQICGPSGWELRVFGSRARGEGDEDSDVDLLVLLDAYDERTKVRIWDAADSVFASTDILLSPHVISREQFETWKRRERLIVQEIERDGIVL